MTWFYYLLEANLYLSVLYLFYRIFLQNETFYMLNRAYLIFSSILSFIIPFFRIGNLDQFMDSKDLHIVYTNPKLEDVQSGGSPLISMENFATTIYLLVASFLFLKLVISLYKITRLVAVSKKERWGKVTCVELTGSVAAFSFFNYLFINPLNVQKNTIVSHEMVHIRQQHTLDIMFFELLRIVSWFNPVVWIVRRDIKLIHEYIADAIITQADLGKHEYALFLIENSFGLEPVHLTNHIFNQSILKQRITMLNKKQSADWARLKMLLALPIVVFMLFASTLAFSKDYATIDLYPKKPGLNILQSNSGQPIQEPTIQITRYFKLDHRIDKKSERVLKYDTRLVVINGKIAKGIIMKVEGFDTMEELKGKEATDRFGSKGGDGALVFTGKNIKTLGLDRVIKFPPPMVVKK
jgi:hypothetical protein